MQDKFLALIDSAVFVISTVESASMITTQQKLTTYII
jgi:hypothetical protein